MVRTVFNDFLARIWISFPEIGLCHTRKTEISEKGNFGFSRIYQMELIYFHNRIYEYKLFLSCLETSCNRIVVSTSRCGRDNPGSNPGYSILFLVSSIDRPRKAVCRPRIKIS